MAKTGKMVVAIEGIREEEMKTTTMGKERGGSTTTEFACLRRRDFHASAYRTTPLQGYQESWTPYEDGKQHHSNESYGGSYDYSYPDNYNNFGYDQ